jgi:histidinol-phosphate/aromatic aminotransferase/cobyric acid decarboxylase-like protein
MTSHVRTVLTIADARDRKQIYRIRHLVYATELAQHPENPAGELIDKLDAINIYLVAKRGETVLGFVSVTPPGTLGYSIDKYFLRADVPLAFDDGLYEIRLLTVVHPARRSDLASLLMYGAFRYCESRGARHIAAIGRLEVLEVYGRAGLRSLGRRVQAGAVTYELMMGDVRDLRRNLPRFAGMMRRFEREVDWRVANVAYRPEDGCYHGGASFEAIGDEFGDLAHASRIISADVLDAWFDPAPAVVQKLGTYLSFSLRTSPPTGCDGMRRVIARARGVGVDNILPGAGSSDLIFAALKAWVTRRSRVLILDPMYGEYAHVLEKVIGVSVDRLRLAREMTYDVEPDHLRTCLARSYDWVILVNPNSPTGRHVPTDTLIELLSNAPSNTRVWIDETYVDYAGGESIEKYAAASANVLVCKSMSKGYALSGVRAAYLCGPASMIQELRVSCPPWSVSLPGQIAACEALRASDYYRQRWQETGALRRDLAESLAVLGWDIVPGCANFLLCHLPSDGPNAAAVAAKARSHGLFLREVGDMGTALGEHALRLAVKNRETNHLMHTILKRTLTELDALRPSLRLTSARK